MEELPFGFMLWDFDLTASSQVPPRGSGQLLLHRFHHGDAVVGKQVQVFVAYS
jgi:hypothetical protein